MLLGINQFSDMTQEEFKTQSLGGYKRLPQPEGAAKKSVKVNVQVMPIDLLSYYPYLKVTGSVSKYLSICTKGSH